jgi:hypothetical protein
MAHSQFSKLMLFMANFVTKRDRCEKLKTQPLEAIYGEGAAIEAGCLGYYWDTILHAKQKTNHSIERRISLPPINTPFAHFNFVLKQEIVEMAI